jgi:hypothetical protein
MITEKYCLQKKDKIRMNLYAKRCTAVVIDGQDFSLACILIQQLYVGMSVTLCLQAHLFFFWVHSFKVCRHASV